LILIVKNSEWFLKNQAQSFIVCQDIPLQGIPDENALLIASETFNVLFLEFSDSLPGKHFINQSSPYLAQQHDRQFGTGHDLVGP